MQSFNHISSAIFDVLLAPFGHEHPAFDLLVWPALMGVLAILVYKVVSNQKALARVKSQISMRLLEIRLFSHDIVQVLASTGVILAKNVVYLGNHMLPMAVMLGPFVVILAQLVANYAYDPTPPGAVELLHVRLDPDAGVASRDVALTLPEGVSLDAPPVQTADQQVFWRLRADAPGDHVLSVKVGDAVFEKGWAVGGGARKVPLKRLRGLEAILYPGELALPGNGPLLSMELGVHSRALGPLPAGELGIVLWVLVWSLVAGFAVKGLFGVTI
ncbi:MAG: hypothetical protein OEO21_08180 [Candidatus Krumholzibacteria bacterium]|nr:hypothetical protein [Candidatus Krumholzibacteria bacterium]MDH5565495.1 hypothetical protein [Myxococcales bacterium]